MPRFSAICLTLLLFFGAGRAMAEHIIGGEMYYTCVGPGQYNFTMKLYRDCYTTGANFDNPAYFGLFDSNNQFISIQQTSVSVVQNINTSVASPCMVLPPNVCVEEGIYNFTITVPNLSETYSVVYQRCCRNATILNLTNPGAQGLSIVSTIPPYDGVGCNSSPSFTNFPPPVLCAQELLEFDHSATDLDGDSLVYSLCSPFIGGTQANPLPVPPSNPPYATVLWGGPYSAAVPLPGNPGLTIHPQTGVLSGIPTQLGQYVIGVCVEEWRDGQLLSINTRDFQFNVAVCEPPSQAIIEIPAVGNLCQGLTVNFTSTSSPSNNFLWLFGDPADPNGSSDLISPSYTYSDTGTYVVTLITNPGFFCSDTASVPVPIYYSAQISAYLAGVECVDGELSYSFTSTGVYEDGAPVVWNFGPGATPPTANGPEVSGVVFASSGNQSIEVQVVNNACSASDVLVIEVAPPVEVAITPQTEYCQGYTHTFSQVSTNATSFIWNFGTTGDGALSTLPNPTYIFPGDGEYVVTLTASGDGNCPVTVQEIVNIHSLLAPQVPSFPVTCFDGHSFNFSAQGSFSANADYTWNFDSAVPAAATSGNVNGVIFLETGTHPFSLTISENGCTRTSEGTITLHNNPVADFDAGPRIGCAPLEVVFQNLCTTESTNFSTTWNFGDGSPEASFASTNTYTTPGIYTVSVGITNLNGCIDSDTKVQTAFIEVLPTPTPGFGMEPLVVSAFDPVITITDGSYGGTSCAYYFDNQEFLDCNFTHQIQLVQPQTITQRVTNGDGCTAEFSRTFRLSDHYIYVPSAFTPNGDGLNELFEPVVTGAASYDMLIFDRWGREVFSQVNVQRGWNGADRTGQYFAQAGVYQYIITVIDYSGWHFDYRGTITLIR